MGVTEKNSSTHQVSRSIQGGFEIPIKVKTRLPYNRVYDLNLKSYKQLVEENYAEPVSGKEYDDAISRILIDIGTNDQGSTEGSDEEVLHKFESSQRMTKISSHCFFLFFFFVLFFCLFLPI